MEKKITGLEAQKNNPDRLNVFLDDEFAFGISRFVGAWLHVGDFLTEDEIAQMVSGDEREKAFQKALHFINYQARSANEVREKLEGLGFSEQIIEDVLSECLEKNYINDRQFAEDWIAARSLSKPRSQKMLGYELRKKQIDESVISRALESAPTDEEMAHALGQKYLPRFTHLDDTHFKQKMEGMLARRAFPFSVIKEEIRILLEMKNNKERMR